MNSDRILYSRKEAAQQLSISISTLEQLIAQGELQVRRLGKRILVPRTELERLSERDVHVVWPSKVNGKTTRGLSA
jgi:excisionase family DNA binding protein